MANYLIQAYSRNMTELLWEENKEFDLTGDALLDACSRAYNDRIITLMIRSEKDPHRFRLIAKFY